MVVTSELFRLVEHYTELRNIWNPGTHQRAVYHDVVERLAPYRGLSLEKQRKEVLSYLHELEGRGVDGWNEDVVRSLKMFLSKTGGLDETRGSVQGTTAVTCRKRTAAQRA